MEVRTAQFDPAALGGFVPAGCHPVVHPGLFDCDQVQRHRKWLLENGWLHLGRALSLGGGLAPALSTERAEPVHHLLVSGACVHTAATAQLLSLSHYCAFLSLYLSHTVHHRHKQPVVFSRLVPPVT